jgi:hypothetical protein
MAQRGLGHGLDDVPDDRGQMLISDYRVERSMFELINQARVSAGHRAVEHHQWLRVKYGDWLIEWFRAGRPEPYYDDERMAERAAIAEGLGFHEVGERIVSFELKLGDMLYDDPPVPEELVADIVGILLEDPDHNVIMLDPRFTHLGLAVIHEELFSDRPNYRTWICPLFAG